MTNLKKNKNTAEASLYVSFHATEGLAFERSAVNISRVMAGTFGESQGLVYSSAEEGELIYRLKKPETVSEELETFFKNLSGVFITLASNQPHFTQYQEGGNNG